MPASAEAATPCLFFGEDASARLGGSTCSPAGVLFGVADFVTVNIGPAGDGVSPPLGSVTSQIVGFAALFHSRWSCEIGAEVAGTGLVTLNFDAVANGEMAGNFLSAK